MSKMDRQLNSKKDKEMIYEIYRACRLCGAGAGYKMPIIQNVVDVDDTEVELKQKVRECVQIEVHQDDKMPPLICELCVDKVNDFYEFLEMCRQTNNRTRLRLGLPPQSMPRGAPDAGECILGLTEPVYVNEDSDGEPLSKQKKVNPKVKVKREPELKVKLENRVLTEVRSTRLTKRSPTPPRVTRNRTSSKEDNVSLSRLKDKPKPSSKPAPKSILKKESKNEDNSLLTPRLKRSRDKEPVKLDTPNKRVKIATKPTPPTPKSPLATSPRSRPPLKSPKVSPKRAPSPKRPASPPRVHKCAVCGQAFKSVQANTNHMKSHTVGFTSPRSACNPCALWFPTAEEAAAHHRQHRSKCKPYECRRCYAEFKYLTAYDEHFDSQCIPFREVPDVKCEVCWHLFATTKLYEEHKCLGEDHRPGGKCSKCRRSYALLKNLTKHEQTCTAKKKGELIVDPVLLSQLKPIQIRVSRCDPLLTNLKQEHYDVSNVTADFGLDKNCVYPYISSYSRLRIKSDPDGMVDINAEIKDEFYAEEDYVHWDSEESESDEEGSCSSPSLVLNPCVKKKKLESLANLSLKTIFSKRCLGKVPKKRRRVKHEKMFDSLLADTEDDVTRDINKIIDNMQDDDDQFDEQKGDESQKSVEVNDSDKSMADVTVSDKDSSNVEEKNDDDGDLVDKNDSIENTEENIAQNDSVLSEKIDQSDENSCASKNFNSISNDSNGSNNNITSNNENKVNNGINSLSFDYFGDEIDSKNDNNDRKSDELKIDFDNSQDSNSIGGVSESLLNDNTQSDVSETEKVDKISNNVDIDNATSLLEQNSELDKEFSTDNLSQDSKISELEAKTNDSNQTTEVQADENQSNDNITEADYNNTSVIINSGKKSTESEVYDDTKLMEALDAQIGNSNESSRDQMSLKGQGNENFNEKIALDELITAKSDTMDGYQDFNFDA